MGFFSRRIDEMVEEKVPHRKRKALIVFISLITLLSMVTSTYAWFKINTFAGVDSLDMHISVSAQLKVSMEDHGTDLDAYEKIITNEMINSYLGQYNTNLDEIILDPVTTSDGIRFTNQRGGERQPNDRSYLQFKCFFIATEDMWVHLTTESTEEQMEDGTKVSTNSTGAKADVINCPRVGFVAENGDNAIYEPNRGTPVNGQQTFDLPSGTMVYSNDTRLFHLNAMEPTEVTISLWIDGEDPQCDDDVQDAHLAVQLGFIGCDEDNIPIS